MSEQDIIFPSSASIDDKTVVVTKSALGWTSISTKNNNGYEHAVNIGRSSIEVSEGVGDKKKTKTIAGSEKLSQALSYAGYRAMPDFNEKDPLSTTEARQFDALRAYITDHCRDGIFDATEIATAINLANNIAPAKKGR